MTTYQNILKNFHEIFSFLSSKIKCICPQKCPYYCLTNGGSNGQDLYLFMSGYLTQ